MATLTYWACAARGDAECYSIVKRTRKEAKAEREAQGSENFSPAQKHVIAYKDAFDLFEQVTGEGGGRLYGVVQNSNAVQAKD